MKTVGQYITDSSAQLNDQYLGREFTRWSRALLLSYLNGARAEVLSYKPHAFAEDVEITLKAGRKQSIDTSAYRDLVGINSNSDGSLVSESDLDLLRAYSPYSCCAGVVLFDAHGNPDYKVKSFAIDNKDVSTFYVSPEVPKGLAPKVNATVIKLPVVYTLADWDKLVEIDTKYQENIMDYMLGRAYDIDSESPMSRSNADRHLSRFYQAMGVKYKVEAAFRAGNWNGQIGDGDPRATAS